ncbi:hypothetical protein niasHS_011045 [Heterodera schachtii]|uniref:Uncharacterized protein n=2 Tax=Heterodera TaxID=34509 RepID=A0ABD2J3R4_HETSC
MQKRWDKRDGRRTDPPTSSDDQQMNPLVAKLLRGESLPTSPQPTSVVRRFNEAIGPVQPAYYAEQIQICVANPGRFLASWALLVTLFGEEKLYDFVRESRWTEAELKPFFIKEAY